MKKYVTREEDVNWISYKELWPKAWSWDKIRVKLLISEDVSGDWGHLRLFRAELDPGQSHRLHHHSEPEFYYILSGKAKMVLGDEEIEVGPGTTIYIPANVKHEITNIGEEILTFLGCEKPHEPSDFHWDLEEMRHIRRTKKIEERLRKRKKD